MILQYNTGSDKVETLCNGVGRGYCSREELLDKYSDQFSRSSLSKTIGLAEELGMVGQKDDKRLSLENNGKRLLEGAKEDAFRIGIQESRTYSEIKDELERRLRHKNAITKNQVEKIIIEVVNPDVARSTVSAAATTCLDVFDAAGIGVYDKRKGRSNVFRRTPTKGRARSDKRRRSGKITSYGANKEESNDYYTKLSLSGKDYRVEVDKKKNRMEIELSQSDIDIEDVPDLISRIKEVVGEES